MHRLFIGSLVAAAAMFMIGFVAYGTGALRQGFGTVTPEVSAQLQTALKALPGTGSYIIPDGEDAAAAAASLAGPTAIIHYNAAGTRMYDPRVFAGGFFHMLVSAFLLGCVLWSVRHALPGFGARANLVFGIAAAMTVYINLAAPIWWHTGWRNALYLALVNFISIAVAGLILAAFIPRRR